MTFCRLIGAEPYLAVNSGLGDAHSAAEEVEYVNGPPRAGWAGSARPTGIPPHTREDWGVGNEMYGPWQWGHMSISQYAEKHNLMVKAMRKVDPAIKVIASGATPEEASWCYIENRQFDTFEGREKVNEPLPFAFGSSQDWTGALLKTLPTTSTTSASTSTATRTSSSISPKRHSSSPTSRWRSKCGGWRIACSSSSRPGTNT